MRLIDADAFKEKFTGKDELMKRVIDDEPTIDQVKHGAWRHIGMVEYCTNCEFCIVHRHMPLRFEFYEYCPNCGALMDL